MPAGKRQAIIMKRLHSAENPHATKLGVMFGI